VPLCCISEARSRMNSISEVVAPLYICEVELSNKFLLKVAAFSFLAFVAAEVVGALASNSLSLLGDAAAMSVDVFTVGTK
jgi:Co/Zn/Cd efflux system component